MESSVAPRVIFQRGNVCTEHSLLKTRQQWRDFDTKPHTTKLRLKLQLRLPQKRSQRPTGGVRNLLVNMGEVICLADPGHPALQRRAMLQQPACCYASLAFLLSFSPCCKNLPLRIAPRSNFLSWQSGWYPNWTEFCSTAQPPETGKTDTWCPINAGRATLRMCLFYTVFIFKTTELLTVPENELQNNKAMRGQNQEYRSSRDARAGGLVSGPLSTVTKYCGVYRSQHPERARSHLTSEA